MPIIKTPIQILSEVTIIEIDMLNSNKYAVLKDDAIEAIESYHSQFDCIDKAVAIRFAQSLTNHEVTEGDLTEFLNKL